MNSLPPLAAYDSIAEWYDAAVREGALLHPFGIADDLWALIGEVRGCAVLDLACGQGVLSRELARRGAARVVGVDLSAQLLEYCRGYEEAEPQGITYLREDAQALFTLPAEDFDGVLCCLALMDIPDLTATLAAVQRVLRAGGWFVAVITHPCFQVPKEEGYRAEGFWRSDNPNGVRGKVGAYHRTLAAYLNAFAAVGLPVVQATEPRLPGRDDPALLLLRGEKRSLTKELLD